VSIKGWSFDPGPPKRRGYTPPFLFEIILVFIDESCDFGEHIIYFRETEQYNEKYS
jgi:hypothetical protein